MAAPASAVFFRNFLGHAPVWYKQAVIAYIMDLQEAPSPGGLSLGRLGPVAEGLFLWAGVMAAFVGLAVWIGIKAR